MIGALNGSVFTVGRNPLILMVNGVGYLVYVPAKLIGQLKKNEKQTLFIHTHVRDDGLDLYGFKSIEELDLFNLLLEVSGIGPKTALHVIDRGVEEVTNAVSQSDVEFFQTIPRLGKKNAQKIIIELKSKLGSLRELDLTETGTSETKEVVDVLLSMGFERREINEALKKLETTDKTVEQKVRKALKLLGK